MFQLFANRNQTFFDQNRYHLTQFFKIEIITQNKDKICGKTPKGNIKTDIFIIPVYYRNESCL